MKKIKLSKSEYIILFNILAAIVSLVLYLMGDAQITDNNGTQALSGVFVGYAAIATIWFCIFVPLDSELYDKRWLTKKEKNYTYLVFLLISAICYVTEGFPLHNLIGFCITSGLWLIFKRGAYSLPEEIDGEELPCPDPYYYESEAKTLQDFGADVSWYNAKMEKQLRAIYIKTAKEFSGKKSKREIELYVRNRVMMAKQRGPKTATCIFLVGMGLIFLLEPLLNNIETFIFILSPLQLYGIFGFAKDMHGPLTPWESKDFRNRDAVEKGGEPIYTIKESVADSNLSNSQVSTSENTPSQKPQDQGLGTSETRHWRDAVLDIKLCETEKKTVSKSDIITEIVVENSKPSIGMFVVAIVFTLPVAVFLVLAINVGWMFLIGVVGFGIFGGLFTWIAIESEVQRRQKLKNATNKDFNISFFARTCTDKQWGDCETGSDDPEPFVVAYQLFFGGKNYRVSKKVYDRINVNDSVMFVRVDGEELSIAYPVKEWSFDD